MVLLLSLLLCDAAIAAALLLLSITPLLLLLLPLSADSLTQSRQWVQQPRTTGQICGEWLLCFHLSAAFHSSSRTLIDLHTHHRQWMARPAACGLRT